MDCIYSELKDVEDSSLILYVSEAILKQEICSLYESFCGQEEMFFSEEGSDPDENDPYIDTECEELEDTVMYRYTIRGQKEKQKENEKEKQQQKALHPNIENNQDIENPINQKTEDVKEIVEFWDNNGFGFTNVNAKQ
nr:hypothetical protein [Neobacillus sp. Marseille-Q6967]